MAVRFTWGILLLVLVGLLTPVWSPAQEVTVFSGIARVKVSEGGTDRSTDQLTADRASESGVVIRKLGDRYYWATRSNKELIPHAAGAFVTFVAVDGAGYVRVNTQEGKSAAASLSPAEQQFDYVEHLLIGLRSITYYGNAL
jgi:hypothetical protein